MRFRVRLGITLNLFPALMALVAGLLDGLFVLFSARYLVWNLMDAVAFLATSVLVYFVVGVGIAVAVALLPPRLFIGRNELDQNTLVAFCLSVFLTLPASLTVIFKAVPFSIFTARFFRNVVIVAAMLASAVIVTRLIFHLLKRASWPEKLYRAMRRLHAWHRVVPGVLGLALVVGINYWMDQRSSVRWSANGGIPNILLISLDTLGARHVSCYGYSRRTTPHLDAFAKKGVLFENAFSHSKWTLPSHMTIMTSTYPAVHQVISRSRVLDKSFVTMAEILKKWGFRCGAFVDRGRFGHVGAAHGFDRGFDFYAHYPERFSKIEKLFVVSHLLNFGEQMLLRLSVPVMHASKITDAALTWLKHIGQNRPFFLFLHYYDIHSEAYAKLPYVSPPPYNTMYYPDYDGNFTGCGDDGSCASLYLLQLARRYRRNKRSIPKKDLKYIESLYDGGISYVDAQVGRLLAELDTMDLDENTLVILTADHGEEFLEHGQLLHGQYYDEIVHVPLIMRLPHVLPENLRVDAVVRHIDILPTVVDLLNLEPLDQFQGESLMPYMRSDSTVTTSRSVFGGLDKPVEENYPHRFVRTDSFKLIVSSPYDSEKVRELYNVMDDPMESNNIVERKPDVAARLEELLDRWENRCKVLRETRFLSQQTEQIKVDKETLKELKSLGYIR